MRFGRLHCAVRLRFGDKLIMLALIITIRCTCITKDIRSIKSYRVFRGAEAPANTDHYLTVAKFAVQPQFKRRLHRTRRFDVDKLRRDPITASTLSLIHI